MTKTARPGPAYLKKQSVFLFDWLPHPKFSVACARCRLRLGVANRVANSESARGCAPRSLQPLLLPLGLPPQPSRAGALDGFAPPPLAPWIASVE